MFPNYQTVPVKNNSNKFFNFKRRGTHFLNSVLLRNSRKWRAKSSRTGSKTSKALKKNKEDDGLEIIRIEESLGNYDHVENSMVQEPNIALQNQLIPQRGNIVISIEPMELIIKNNSSMLEIEEIRDSQSDILMSKKNETKAEKEELSTLLPAEETIEKDESGKCEMKNVSKDEFVKVTDSDNCELIGIDLKISQKDSSPILTKKDDTQEVKMNTPVNAEISQSKKPKCPHVCLQACPCQFSQELIEIYHRAKKISKKSEKMSKAKKPYKFRMTKSEIDFFKADTRMCSVMIGQTKSRRAEMRELMDMWQEANEKMALRKKDIISTADNIESVRKKLNDVQDLLKNWFPGQKMDSLKENRLKVLREEEDSTEMLEDEERKLAKEKIERILEKREIWLAEERSRAEERKNQESMDISRLTNAIEVMQRYINERESLLNN